MHESKNHNWGPVSTPWSMKIVWTGLAEGCSGPVSWDTFHAKPVQMRSSGLLAWLSGATVLFCALSTKRNGEAEVLDEQPLDGH